VPPPKTKRGPRGSSGTGPSLRARPIPSRREADAPGFSRTRRDHQRELAEDYVELIDALIEEKGEARAVDLARCLGVSHVTVVRTLERLQRDGWITTEPYRAVFLTDAGRELAGRTRARHETVLRFLLAVGVPPTTALLDAEGIEHHVSPQTLEALRRLTEKLSPGR